MARSKHTTRRDLVDESRRSYRDRGVKRQRLKEAKQDLREKRTIKRQVREERRRAPRKPSAPVDAATIPIRVTDHGPFVHYPATVEELRQLLRRLPPGSADGLEGIELTLGRETQREFAVEKGVLNREADPHVGRIGCLFLPGVYAGYVGGVYFKRRGLVRLHAFVYDQGIQNVQVKETYLKLYFLSTLVHEIAHHDDKQRRVRRGRWRFDQQKKMETYTNGAQHGWVQEVVIPYLREACPERLAEVEDWIERHARVRIPFELCEDTSRFRVFISSWFEGLLEDVESGKDARTVRRNLAHNLHLADELNLALEVVEALIREDSSDLSSLTAKADFLRHLGRHEEAREILREVLRLDPDSREAWNVQGLVAENTKDWAAVLEATTQELRLASLKKAHGRCRHLTLARQARSLLELGRLEELKEPIDELKAHGTRFAKSQGFGFEALSLLRSGKLHEALCAANDGLKVAGGTAWRHELLAVSYEVLCRTGRKAEPLGERTTDLLQRRGYEDWVRTLKDLK
jgi:tetratricopeptide (TPR) repeat protein